MLTSETCALDIIGAKYVRDVEHGEIIIISEDGMESIKPFPKVQERPCIFEEYIFQDLIVLLMVDQFIHTEKI